MLARRAARALFGIFVVSVSFLVGCAPSPSGPRPERLAPLIWGETWRIGTSENFEIFSAVSEEETRTLLRELELFRAVIFATTNAERRSSPIPTRIFAFDSDRDYRGFAARDGTAGLFAPGMRANTVLITNGSRRQSAESVIKHEYVHFVVQNGARTAYPLWYDEGFAEFLSSARVSGDVVVIGGVPPARVGALRSGAWIPLRKIVAATSYESVEGANDFMLYPEAWALVHHLTLGRRPERGVMAAQLSRFMNLRQRGIEATAAFESAFDVDLFALDRKLQRTLRKGDIRIGGLPVESLSFDRTPARIRQASASEAAARLGALALFMGQTRNAGRYFEKALELDPTNAAAMAGLGDHHKFSGQDTQAEPFFREAFALAPGDALIRLDLGEFLDDRAGRALSRASARRDRGEARQLFESVVASDPDMPEAHAVLGSSFVHGADEGEGSAALARARRHLERAHALLPSNLDVTVRLVEVLLGAGDREGARQLVQSAMATRLSKRNAGSVDEILAKLDARRDARLRRWSALPEEAPTETANETPASESGEAQAP